MSHHHQHQHNYAEANEKFFDGQNNLLSSEEGRKVSGQAAQAFLDAFQFDKEKTTALDFACGIGGISLPLAPHCKSILGVDISTGMVNSYNENAKKEGLGDKLSAVRADILTDPSPLGDRVFDVIVCSLSYHHFSSPADMTRALSKVLRPGGHILIVDLLTPFTRPDETDPEVKKIIAHGSFSEDDMRGIFEAGDIELKKYAFAFDMTFKGHDSKCFCAVGQKKV